jgi:hypothetical protein
MLPAMAEPESTPSSDPMLCARCQVALEYVCPRCGRVELFVDGIGEEFRPH